MATARKDVIESALSLSTVERVELVELLLKSLDAPNKSIDAVWAEESEFRVDAYEAGEIKTVSSEQVFSKYQK
ncbi:MAG: hypothetical protein CMF25_03420 [Kangiellaceae bacterium]|jgi:putative addiction module component (TIGR02574 family)|nr:hypothetical protein [Kangiellaceae bacterium]